MQTITAGEIMTAPAVTVAETSTLRETARTMLANGVGSVVVVRDDGTLAGVMTDDDFTAERVPLPFSTAALARALGHWLGEGDIRSVYRAEAESPVADFMRTHVASVDEAAPLADVVRLMLDRNVTHLPVVRDDRPVGVITRRNLLQLLYREELPPAP